MHYLCYKTERMRYFISMILSVFLLSCEERQPSLTAQNIVDKAIENACQGRCESAIVQFDFRKRQYRSERRGGAYRFERITSDSLGILKDILSNEGFSRYRNDSLVILPDSMSVKYGNSVNSVHYFAQLPYGLNAEAVQKKLLGEDVIKQQPYYEIEVRFSEEGGGADFEDTFVYWIHKEKFTVDYLAYAYATDGGGIRFREAYNPRVVAGLRFVDYNNFKPASLDVALKDLDQLFESGALQLLSKIETEGVNVELVDL